VSGVTGCHPLASFGDALLPDGFYRSIHFVVQEGDRRFDELFPDLPNPHVTIPLGVEPAYHTAAVLSGNFTAFLWRRAAEEFGRLGIPAAAWHTYLDTVASNLRADPEAAATGPLVRGDAGTIAAHLGELGDDPWADVYRAFLKTTGVADPTVATLGGGVRIVHPTPPARRHRRRARPDDALAVFRSGRPLVATTAYDASTAAILDDTPLDFLLVGDSVAMVVYGHRSTRPADVEMLVRHTAAVRRGAPSKPVVADLPWVAARDPGLGVSAARALLDAGADAVKLEALPDSWDVLAELRASGVPVMGHVGLLPQLVEEGEYRVAGRGEAAEAVREAARLQEEAGCFALVVECVPSDLGAEITRERSVPTIGIGAGPGTSGQILVIDDMVGFARGRTPRFVREFGDAAGVVSEAVQAYVRAVHEGSFPGSGEQYG
jgi:3-methyl-2-oxobutanoate hydroxymethyltransferase